MINIIKKLFDYIYIKKCYFCGKSFENTVFCSKCYEKIDFLPPKPIKYIEGIPVYSACVYSGGIKKLIRAVKYHNIRELAYYQAKIMSNYWNILGFKEKFLVLPTPIYSLKSRNRKYNHVELFTEIFAQKEGYDYSADTLKRIKETKPQYKLSVKEREENLKNAFALEKDVASKKILLIDDISTSGATLKEMIKCLSAKTQDIVCFVTAIPESSLNL